MLPSHPSIEELSQRFNSQFTDKISNVRMTLQGDLNDGNSLVMSSVDSAFEGVPLKELRTVNTATVESMINKSISKFCELDPLPTWLLKECIAELVPVITSIIDASIKHSNVHTHFKIAHMIGLFLT